jgi:hypothetical protein
MKIKITICAMIFNVLNKFIANISNYYVIDFIILIKHIAGL